MAQTEYTIENEPVSEAAHEEHLRIHKASALETISEMGKEFYNTKFMKSVREIGRGYLAEQATTSCNVFGYREGNERWLGKREENKAKDTGYVVGAIQDLFLVIGAPLFGFSKDSEALLLSGLIYGGTKAFTNIATPTVKWIQHANKKATEKKVTIALYDPIDKDKGEKE